MILRLSAAIIQQDPSPVELPNQDGRRRRQQKGEIGRGEDVDDVAGTNPREERCPRQPRRPPTGTGYSSSPISYAGNDASLIIGRPGRETAPWSTKVRCQSSSINSAHNAVQWSRRRRSCSSSR